MSILRTAPVPAAILLAAVLFSMWSGNAAARLPSDTDSKVRQLQERILRGADEPLPAWAIGPFSPARRNGRLLVFRPQVNWKDPAGVPGWKPAAFWNPALIEDDGRLYMFYRTGPSLEGLHSRIGLAWSDDGGKTWADSHRNPIVYPTDPDEQLGVEDPRVYRRGGTYYLYYVAVEKRAAGGVFADICLATSDDLLTWKKHGPVVPRSISGGWAKSAVIPRSQKGDAVAIDGQFLMYISERPYASHTDTGEQMIGRSTNLIHWRFEQTAFLDPRAYGDRIGSIHEMASMSVLPSSGDMVADVFYEQRDGTWRCGQVLYSQREPLRASAFTSYGVCSWGGKIVYRGQWLYAQGWLEPGSISLYSAPGPSR